MQPISSAGAVLGSAPSFDGGTQVVFLDDFQFADNLNLYPDEVDGISGTAGTYDDTGTYADSSRMGVLAVPLNSASNQNWSQNGGEFIFDALTYYRFDVCMLLTSLSAAPTINMGLGVTLATSSFPVNPASTGRRLGWMLTNTTSSGLTAFQLSAVQSQITPTFLTIEYSESIVPLYNTWITLGAEYVAGDANPLRWYLNGTRVAQATNTPNWTATSKQNIGWAKSGLDGSANFACFDWLRIEYRCTR